jgi:hypothetical protein
MPDANTIRQRRHERCKATTECPKCFAPAGRGCIEVTRVGRIYNGHVYSRQAWLDAINHAGRGAGKTTMNMQSILGRFSRLDEDFRKIKGLHRERWEATPDAILLLAEIGVEPA